MENTKVISKAMANVLREILSKDLEELTTVEESLSRVKARAQISGQSRAAKRQAKKCDPQCDYKLKSF